MKSVAHTALAVAVISGWLLALVWLATSVAQIAVDRVLVPPACVTAGGASCP